MWVCTFVFINIGVAIYECILAWDSVRSYTVHCTVCACVMQQSLQLAQRHTVPSRVPLHKLQWLLHRALHQCWCWSWAGWWSWWLDLHVVAASCSDLRWCWSWPLHLVLAVVVTGSNLWWWCFSLSRWHRLPLHPLWFHPLQLALVVFFLPPTGADTRLALGQLALCGGMYIHRYAKLNTTRLVCLASHSTIMDHLRSVRSRLDLTFYSVVDKDLWVKTSCNTFWIIATCVALERFCCSFRM